TPPWKGRRFASPYGGREWRTGRAWTSLSWTSPRPRTARGGWPRGPGRIPICAGPDRHPARTPDPERGRVPPRDPNRAGLRPPVRGSKVPRLRVLGLRVLGLRVLGLRVRGLMPWSREARRTRGAVGGREA